MAQLFKVVRRVVVQYHRVAKLVRKMVFGICVTGFVLNFSSLSNALELYDAGKITEATTPERLSLEALLTKIPKGSIVVIGEQHNYAPIQNGQMTLLMALRNAGHKINVAMEFLKYTDQSLVDHFRLGTLPETDFLKAAWGEADFKFYRQQILFPSLDKGERTFAVNSPKQLPLAVKTKGLANLSDEERALLPPNFQLGGALYKERFIERMQGHVTSEEAMNRYFETQSVWDDTMAWKACDARMQSDHTLVLVVGQFHVEYGDGLIHRLRERCGATAKITSLYQFMFYQDEQVDFNYFAPSAKFGPLSDYLMIVKEGE